MPDTSEMLAEFLSDLLEDVRVELIQFLCNLNEPDEIEAQEESDEDHIPQERPIARLYSSPRRGGRGDGVHFEAKVINGCGSYLYLRFWDGRHHRSRYIGKISKIKVEIASV